VVKCCVFLPTMLRYFVVYKPYGMLSQFVSPYDHRLLGDLDFRFPEGTHAVGRLDEDSEGLLLLTTDKTMTRRLMHPALQHKKVYVVRVVKHVEEAALHQLRNGIEIKVKQRGVHLTQPCTVEIIPKPDDLAEIHTNFKEFVPHTWLRMVLTEGKNRQIRKMCKAVGHSCKRLIRVAINDLTLMDMQPGEVHEMDRDTVFALLKLDPTDEAPTRWRQNKPANP